MPMGARSSRPLVLCIIPEAQVAQLAQHEVLVEAALQ